MKLLYRYLILFVCALLPLVSYPITDTYAVNSFTDTSTYQYHDSIEFLSNR